MTDRRVLMIGVLVIVGVVLVGLFYIDITTENEILNETIVGMLIGSSFTALTSYVAYYTTGDNEVNPNGQKDDEVNLNGQDGDERGNTT